MRQARPQRNIPGMTIGTAVSALTLPALSLEAPPAGGTDHGVLL